MTRTIRFGLALSTLLLAEAAAQVPTLRQPEASPRASVSQTVGLTEMSVTYHRPAVAGRKVWGELVPLGEVWRAGANENTTVTFSTAVQVAGKPLAAGTYGLHAIPTAKEWTIIFSRMAVAWGSYSYDAKEDALRVTVTPQPSEAPIERLAFSFDDPTEDGATLALRWEKLKVAIPIHVDTPQVVMESMRAELRGLARFSSEPWNRAAGYWLEHGGSLDEALQLSDKSLERGETFANLEVRGRILEKKGDAQKAAELRARAMTLAGENDLNLYGYALLQKKKPKEAVEIFAKNTRAHPASWNAWDSLGEAQAIVGDRKAATESYRKALSLTKDETQRKRIESVLARLAKQ